MPRKQQVTSEDADRAMAAIVSATKMMKGTNRKAARQALGRLRRFVTVAATSLPSGRDGGALTHADVWGGGQGGWLKS
jgi:hypothetical protein